MKGSKGTLPPCCRPCQRELLSFALDSRGKLHRFHRATPYTARASAEITPAMTPALVAWHGAGRLDRAHRPRCRHAEHRAHVVGTPSYPAGGACAGKTCRRLVLLRVCRRLERLPRRPLLRVVGQGVRPGIDIGTGRSESTGTHNYLFFFFCSEL